MKDNKKNMMEKSVLFQEKKVCCPNVREGEREKNEGKRNETDRVEIERNMKTNKENIKNN